MLSTLSDGDIVFVSYIPYIFKDPIEKDVVVINFNEYSLGMMIKRIDHINNKKYWVLGDNLADSLDSRKLGYIEKHHILGKAFLLSR
jgi:signal peptidase I